MRKKIFAAAAIAGLLVLFCFALVGCDNIDRSVFPEGYVEVTDLRVKSANVYLSPNGDTSSYQLEVEVLPANANRALSYYVPSQYLKYISVTENGLITAKEVTPDDVIIPLKVTSKTNKNASLIINVTVTEVEVERVYFTPASLTMYLYGEPQQLNPVYEPYHAQDGRALTYTSTNTNVCTVSSEGLVTPVGAGHSYIYVSSQTLAGTTIEAWVPVEVNYVSIQSLYRLEVTDSAPAYRQVVGEAIPIKFNLVKLNEHLNPNVDIQWYVDAEPVKDHSIWQYTHVPTVQTKTSYQIHVEIHSYSPDEVAYLHSEEIVIYEKFSGYELTFDNMSSARAAYQYGSTQTFSITAGQSGIVRYLWYLKRLGESGKGQFLAETPAADRDLTARMNVEGDFVLTAYGLDNGGNRANEKEFEFSVTRFIEGDTLIIEPSLIGEGLPPESYDFYLTECEEDGTATSSPRYIGAASYGERFLYPLSSVGHYKISSRAILDGVVAKVEGEEFFTETEVVHVYDGETQELSRAEDLVLSNSRYVADKLSYVIAPTISGVKTDDGAFVVVRWDTAKGVPSYVVEVTKEDGTVYLLDSDGGEKNAYGNNHVVLPKTVATLTDKFSVRVKVKGGVFSERFYYGSTAPEGKEAYYTSTVPTELYDYLVPVSGVINGYLTSVADLGKLISYTVLYGTGANRRIDNVDYKVYALSVYPAFDYVAAAVDYPAVPDENLSQEYEDIYCVTLGAQTAYAPTGYYRYGFVNKPDGGIEISVLVPDVNGGIIRSDAIEKEVILSPNYSEEPYGSASGAFLVNTRKKIRVTDSEQLYYALSYGNAVTLANDAMVNLYGKITSVVNSIIDDDMTDGQKALAFYDWLTQNVVYDSYLAEREVGAESALYAGFRLEGVFHYGQAVCDGIAKAYVALCAIEGIPCVRVAGEINGEPHAWNKVYVDGEWYVVDATNGSLLENGVLYGTHSFFGLTDEEYGNRLNDVREIGEYPAAEGSYDYYEDTLYGCGLTIHSQDDLNAIINAFGRLEGRTELEVLFDIQFADTPESILAAIRAVDNQTNNDISETVVYLTDNRVILILE